MLSQTVLSTNSPRLRIPIIKMKVVRGGYSYSDNPVITDSGSAFRFMHPYFEGHDREEMVALMLNAKHRMLGLHTISIGSAQFSIVHPRETFKAAIVMNAVCLILAHNHPSGDPAPSAEDGELTRRLVEAGKLLGITVLDHIIIGEGQYYSFQDSNRL
ncbi:MAG: UPF0758 family protein [Nitrospira sp.]|jgi:DNA repair protein RadC|nr:UPF0758 family protein [Nitrospira sp.]